MTLEELMSARKEQILRRFVMEVASMTGAPAVSRAQLTDSIPWFLDELERALHGIVRDTRPSAHEERPARQHGQQRYELGFDLPSVVHEYGLLCDAILAVATEDGVQLTNAEFACLHQSLQLGIEEAVHAYLSHAGSGAQSLPH